MTQQLRDDSKSMLGFWTYLMTDCLLFGSLFATYAVLQGNIFDGPSPAAIFDLEFVFVETVLLLTSSFTIGLALLSVARGLYRQTAAWLIVTLLLGVSFLGLELYEFRALIDEGNSWARSGFLTAFFTLVGTHGLHILVGLLWGATLLALLIKRGISETLKKRLTIFSVYWHFLDVVWIFIFTIVYLFGAKA